MTRWFVPLVVLVLVTVNIPALATTVPQTDTILVWESGGMTPETLDVLVDLAEARGLSVSESHRGTLQMISVSRGDATLQEAPPGFVIPMSTLAIDPDASLPIIGSAIADALRQGKVVMGASSAKLRGAEQGDAVTFIGWNGEMVSAEIGAIAPDDRVDSNELIFSIEHAQTFGFSRLSYVQLWGFEDKDALFRELVVTFVNDSVGVDADPGRRADDVLPDIAVKRQFGEFAYRWIGPGDQIEIDPRWVDANIVTVDLPLLGLFKCHRSMVPYLEGAIDEVIATGLGSVVDRADFQLAGGCYNARLIRGGDKGGSLSRHSWGIAVDINPSTNPYGGVVAMDRRVAEIFHKWGFAWGGGWVFSDGAHFEWTRLPVSVVDT